MSEGSLRRCVALLLLLGLGAYSGAADKKPCPPAEFLEVPAMRASAAQERLGKEAWRLLSVSEAGALVRHDFSGWRQVALVKAARGKAERGRLDVAECEDGLVVQNLDLCPDGPSRPLYLLVRLAGTPATYVFGWKGVGRDGCK
jgi:hypothetical protein